MKRKLRAFKTSNYSLTESQSSIVQMLRDALTTRTTIQDRRMKLNQQDDDEDLLAFFKWTSNNNVLFGMIMRIIPADLGGILPDDFSERQTIKMDDLNVNDATQSQYKSRYYFATDGNYLVTDLSQSASVERLQTYINWLIEQQRGDTLFSYAPVMIMPQGVRVHDIKSIEFSGTKITPQTEASDSGISSRLISIQNDVLNTFFGGTPTLAELQNEQLVSAQVIVKFKKKPKEMEKDEYQRVMSAIARNVTENSGYAIRTKNGRTYTGEQICSVKDVEIEENSQRHINEEQLSQEMERFLLELNAENNQ